MRLTLRQLQIFVSIAHTGSTTAAAEQVSLSQSAVSAAMSELERNLDTNLFDRVGKRLLLNDSGRAVLPQALALLRSAEDLEQSCLEKHPSLLRLGASLTIGNYLLPKLLADYWRLQGIQAGDATPPMQITVANTIDIAARVENFELDIGLVEGTCHRSGVHVTPWMDDELLIVVSPRHPIAQQYGRGIVPASRLKQANWLLREPGSGTREVLEQALLPQLNQIRSTLQFSDHEAIKHACAEGLGIACLSRLAVTEMLEAGRLVDIQSELGTLKRNFHILTHEKKQMTFGMQRFIDFLRLQAEHPAHGPLEG